jgi:hypothetical protein
MMDIHNAIHLESIIWFTDLVYVWLNAYYEDINYNQEYYLLSKINLVWFYIHDYNWLQITY